MKKTMKKIMNRLIVVLLCLPLAAVAWQESPDQAAAPPAGCNSPEHRQFDFWAGEWEVTQNGQPAGHNRIEVIQGGCVLQENWTSATAGFTGTSFNTWSPQRGQWHQTWVDTSGTLLLLDGGLVDGSMVLSGERPGADGATVSDRITWTPNEDGSVRQHWETSRNGQDWATVFDGLYVRTKGDP